MVWKYKGLMISLWLLLFAILQCEGQSKTCTQISSCSCRFDNGRVLDLSPLDTKSTGIYRFKALANDGYNYFYNPCSGLTCDPSATPTASACQKDLSEKWIYDIGDETSAAFKIRNGKLAIFYSATIGSRQSYITLNCDCNEDGRMTAKGVDTPGGTTYDMDLYTRHACDVECPSTNGASGGLSIGDILLIIFFVLLIVYLVAGIVINVVVRKKEGKERIPNVGFWSAIPGLTLEGFRFCLNKIRGRGNNYQEIK